MSEVIQEMFKESSVNNSLKSVPNESMHISHWTDVKSFFGLHLFLHNKISRWKLWNLLNLFGRALWNNDKNNIHTYFYSIFIYSYSSLLLIYYIIYKIWRVWVPGYGCYRRLEIIYGPKWLWAEMVMGWLVMGRFGYGPKWPGTNPGLDSTADDNLHRKLNCEGA